MQNKDRMGSMEGTQKRKLLVVCTGNTCRSPMAAAVLNRMLDEQGLSDRYTAVSAGVAAFDGQPATPNAVEAAREEGLDLSRHKAQRITLEAIDEAEWIFVMSEEHRRLLANALPDSEGKISVMRVSDPYGADLETYRLCLRQVRDFFERYFKEYPLCAE